MSYGGYDQSKRKFKDVEGRVASFAEKITGRKRRTDSGAPAVGDQQATMAAVALAGSAAAYYAIVQLQPAALFDGGQLCPYRTAAASLAAGAGVAILFSRPSL